MNRIDYNCVAFEVMLLLTTSPNKLLGTETEWCVKTSLNVCDNINKN